MTMTYPLVAFGLWLLSSSTNPLVDPVNHSPVNPAEKFILAAGVKDTETKQKLRDAGSKILSDTSLQNNLTKGRDAFSSWLDFYGSDDVSVYPRSCKVYPAQVSAIANLAIGALREKNFILALKERPTDDVPETPYQGISLALLTMSAPSLDETQLCNSYMCGGNCRSDVFLQSLFIGLKAPKFAGNVDTLRTFYQQYIGLLSGLGVNTNVYPGGWTCAIKNDLHIASFDSTDSQ